MAFSIHSRYHRASIDLPHRIDARDLFALVSEAIGVKLVHRITLWNEGEEERVFFAYDGEIELPDGGLLYPEQKLIVWVFTTPDADCIVEHLWQDDMPMFLALSGYFPDGCAYGRFGCVIDDQHEWKTGANQLFAFPFDCRPKGKDPSLSWRGPSVCACDLLEDTVVCPNA